MHEEKKAGISTGFSDLDEIRCIYPRELIVIGGETSSGKSIFALNICLNMSIKNGSTPVAFFH